ncbi:MAG: methionyl-tRNA formyltransferase [Luteitalea sp.]|nr:methionyl-tRNA formyltransferase [Luteitalea sp.]
MRVIFFGTPTFAVPTLEGLWQSRHAVVGVVTQPDRPRGRGQHVQPSAVKAAALAHDLAVWQPGTLKDEAFLAMIRSAAPDLGVVAAYGKLLPDVLLAIPRLGLINVHASLLPRYRGASPIQRAVLAGDAETGVSIMRVVAALDAGAVLAQRRHPIGPDDTSGDVERALATLGASLLCEMVDRLAAGPVQEVPQQDAHATYAPRLRKEEGLVDWSHAASTLHNHVRAMQPWPGASTFLDGERLVIRRTRVDLPTTAPPGTIIEADHDVLRVATGDNSSLRVLELQPSGRRAMTVRDFLAGRRLAAGARFTGPS